MAPSLSWGNEWVSDHQDTIRKIFPIWERSKVVIITDESDAFKLRALLLDRWLIFRAARWKNNPAYYSIERLIRAYSGGE